MSVSEIMSTVGRKHEDGIQSIEKISVDFEEFETYFLTIFENREKKGIRAVYDKIFACHRKRLNSTGNTYDHFC